MFNKLFFRIFLALWIVSAGMIIIAGLYINFTLDEAFTSYIRSAEARELENIAENVNEIIQTAAENEEDSREVRHTLNHIASTHNTRILITDMEDNVIYDSGDTHGPRGPMHNQPMHDQIRGPMEGSNRGPERGTNNNEKEVREKLEADITQGDVSENGMDQTIFSYPIEINGTPAGEILLTSLDRGADFYTSEELDFISQLTGTILAGGGIALVISLIVSSLISFTISRPVEKLIQAAEKIKNGHFSQRAPVNGPEELKQLAGSFNSMAEAIEQTNYLKEKLTQDISHELRNPVASIKGYLEAFQDGILPPGQENLQSTLDELERLDDLTEELHQLALVNFQQVPMEQKRLELNHLGEKAAKFGRALASNKALDFEANLPDKAMYIMGDEKFLMAAIKNLLKNAVNYTDSGRVIFSIYKNNVENQAVIEVTDTGPGIPKNKLPYIFERFYRAEDARDRQTGGSGLGLALVKEWTETMGGDVAVSSTLKEGSSFRLFFPCKDTSNNQTTN